MCTIWCSIHIHFPNLIDKNQGYIIKWMYSPTYLKCKWCEMLLFTKCKQIEQKWRKKCEFSKMIKTNLWWRPFCAENVLDVSPGGPRSIGECIAGGWIEGGRGVGGWKGGGKRGRWTAASSEHSSRLLMLICRPCLVRNPNHPNNLLLLLLLLLLIL